MLSIHSSLRSVLIICLETCVGNYIWPVVVGPCRGVSAKHVSELKAEYKANIQGTVLPNGVGESDSCDCSTVPRSSQ